jgi:uncharacterized Tic20 family protein
MEAHEDSPASTLPIPTPDEQALAFLAHFLQVFAWFIAPRTVYLLKRDSRFVSFHALQALFWQIIYMALYVVGFIAFFVSVFSIVPDQGKQPPLAFFIFFPLIWLLFVGGWLLTLIIGIVYGVRAMRGEWAAYPIIGRWAKRIVKV